MIYALNAELSCIGELCEFHCLKARKGSARSERSRRSIRASSSFSSFSLSSRETTPSRIVSSSSFDCHFMDDKITLPWFSRCVHFPFPFSTIKYKSFASILVNIWYISTECFCFWFFYFQIREWKNVAMNSINRFISLSIEVKSTNEIYK